MSEKICTKCGEVKNEIDFHKGQSRCKVCRAQLRRRTECTSEAVREKNRLYCRAYRLAHTAERKIWAKAYREAHKGAISNYNKQHYAGNSVERRAYAKKHAASHQKEHRDGARESGVRVRLRLADSYVKSLLDISGEPPEILIELKRAQIELLRALKEMK